MRLHTKTIFGPRVGPRKGGVSYVDTHSVRFSRVSSADARLGGQPASCSTTHGSNRGFWPNASFRNGTKAEQDTAPGRRTWFLSHGGLLRLVVSVVLHVACVSSERDVNIRYLRARAMVLFRSDLGLQCARRRSLSPQRVAIIGRIRKGNVA